MKNKKRIKDFIEHGSSLAGSLVGTATGLLVAGPGGALIGAGVGPVLTSAIIEVADRFLSEKEKDRMAAVAVFAAIKADKNLKSGKKLRNDKFFKIDRTGQSKAGEIFEGVLIKVKDTYEEKKIRYLGNFFANLMFDSSISAAYANRLLNYAETLTYRQLMLIAYIANIKKFNPKKQALKVKEINREQFSILQELYSMDKEFLICEAEPKATHSRFMMGVEFTPAKLRLRPTAGDLYALMELSQIPAKEIEKEVAKYLEKKD